MSETNPTDGREVVRCWIGTHHGETHVWMGPSMVQARTPAVAVPEDVYNEVRQTLRNAVAILAHVGRRDMMDECRKMLERLPEIPQ